MISKILSSIPKVCFYQDKFFQDFPNGGIFYKIVFNEIHKTSIFYEYIFFKDLQIVEKIFFQTFTKRGLKTNHAKCRFFKNIFSSKICKVGI